MYRLYINKEKFEMRIEPVGNLFIYDTIDYTEPYFYNNNYFVCADRNKLQELARQIKAEWTDDYMRKLNQVENMKIKNKYK